MKIWSLATFKLLSLTHSLTHTDTFVFVCITVCILYPESQFASSLFMCPYSVFVNMSKNILSVCVCVCELVCELVCECSSVMTCFFRLILADPVSSASSRKTDC